MSRCTKPGLVGGVQAVEHLEEEPGRVGDAERAVPLAADHLEEAHAGNVFQDHEVDVSVVAHGERPRHVGMIAALGELHLAAETEEAVRLLEDFRGRQDLDGDLGEGLLVDGEEHLSHAPLAQGAEDPVAAQEKTPGGAGQKLAGLVGREQSLLNQQSSQPHRGVGRGFRFDLARACVSSAAGTSPDRATFSTKSSSWSISSHLAASWRRLDRRHAQAPAGPQSTASADAS